jgi:hypothetical protein
VDLLILRTGIRWVMAKNPSEPEFYEETELSSGNSSFPSDPFTDAL